MLLCCPQSYLPTAGSPFRQRKEIAMFLDKLPCSRPDGFLASARQSEGLSRQPEIRFSCSSLLECT